jgi:hypothetical protein
LVDDIPKQKSRQLILVIGKKIGLSAAIQWEDRGYVLLDATDASDSCHDLYLVSDETED